MCCGVGLKKKSRMGWVRLSSECVYMFCAVLESWDPFVVAVLCLLPDRKERVLKIPNAKTGQSATSTLNFDVLSRLFEMNTTCPNHDRYR